MVKTHLVKSFTTEMLEYGKKPSSLVRTFNITTAGKTISDILHVKENDQVYYIERTRLADDTPVLFERTFMSVDLHPELSIKTLQASKYDYGDQVGLRVDNSIQTVSPIFPSEYISSELHIPTTQPILRVCNTTYTQEDQVFDYSELYLHPELYQYNVYKKREV